MPPDKRVADGGFTLVELMVTMIIGVIGIGIVVMLVTQAHNNLNDSKRYADRQSDLDLACYTLKGIIEEADAVSPSSGSTDHLTVSGPNLNPPPARWQSEFYPDGVNLVHESLEHGTGSVITGLSSLSFEPNQTNKTVTVRITVSDLPERAFVVRVRNWK